MTRPIIPIDPRGLDDMADALLNGETSSRDQDAEFSVKANIHLGDYIKIPNTNILIAKQETHRGKDWQTTIKDLSQEGLFMPSPALFLPYFLKVKEAAEGRIMLYDGSNKPIQGAEADDLWKYMTSNHRNGCWAWLDAKFLQDKNNWYLETNHRIVSGKLVATRLPLESCLRKDAYVDLRFNSQGLATTRSATQKYSLGNNIYFFHPRDGTVARFYANSDRAGLICDWDPAYSIAGLGVFSCAEGAKQKIRESKK